MAELKCERCNALLAGGCPEFVYTRARLFICVDKCTIVGNNNRHAQFSGYVVAILSSEGTIESGPSKEKCVLAHNVHKVKKEVASILSEKFSLPDIKEPDNI